MEGVVLCVAVICPHYLCSYLVKVVSVTLCMHRGFVGCSIVLFTSGKKTNDLKVIFSVVQSVAVNLVHLHGLGHYLVEIVPKLTNPEPQPQAQPLLYLLALLRLSTGQVPKCLVRFFFYLCTKTLKNFGWLSSNQPT